MKKLTKCHDHRGDYYVYIYVMYMEVITVWAKKVNTESKYKEHWWDYIQVGCKMHLGSRGSLRWWQWDQYTKTWQQIATSCQLVDRQASAPSDSQVESALQYFCPMHSANDNNVTFTACSQRDDNDHCYHQHHYRHLDLSSSSRYDSTHTVFCQLCSLWPCQVYYIQVFVQRLLPVHSWTSVFLLELQ